METATSAPSTSGRSVEGCGERGGRDEADRQGDRQADRGTDRQGSGQTGGWREGVRERYWITGGISVEGGREGEVGGSQVGF